MYLLRKIIITNWPDKDSDFDINEISADAATKDIITDNNYNSWWLIEELNDKNFELIAAAIGSQYKSKSRIALVAIPLDVMKNISQRIKTKSAICPVIGAGKRHRNVKFKDYKTISKLITEIANKTISDESAIRNYSYDDVIGFMKQLDKNKLIDKDLLNEFILELNIF